MRRLRLALAQLNLTVGDLTGNCRKIIANLEAARVGGADLVIFPELAMCGYPPEDLLLRPAFLRACRESLEQIVAASAGITAIVGYPEEAGGCIYNSAAVIAGGRLAASYRKQCLPNYGVFDEERYFAPSLRNHVFTLRGVCFGVSVCEDIWLPDGPYAQQAAVGRAELLINISASPYHRGKGEIRERMLATRAADHVAALAFCNLVGGQDELVFDGGSVVFDAAGGLLARGRQFAEDLLLVDIDFDAIMRRRLYDARVRPHHEVEDAPLRLELSAPAAAAKAPLPAAALAAPLEDLAEVYAALVTGTRDYVRKNGFSEVVLGLSGGIDSALTACVAVSALGKENVHGISMPSRYSSDHSKVDAEELAKNLGISFITIAIEPAFNSYLELLAPSFAGRNPGLAEENLQARIRGNLLMALSNKFGWMVLTTGNKSENAAGYATLYGDMAGGFAVIKDVPKMLVFQLSRYRNTLSAAIPESTLTKPPSAELRLDQKDSDSLPEYDVLDPILAAYVEEYWTVAEMLAAGFGASTVASVVKLVDRAEYKRRQAPPGVRITPRAFGKDRRMPITNHFTEVSS